MSDPKKIKTNRLIAAIIDGILLAIVNAILGVILAFVPAVGALLAGVIGAALYALKDAYPIPALDGASPGKKIMKIKAVNMNGANLTPEESIKRNLPLVFGGAVNGVLSLLPTAIYLPLAGLIGFAQLGVVIAETYFLWSKPDGRRWGDNFGSTQVVSTEGVAATAGGFPPPPPSAVPPPPPAQSAAAPPPPPPTAAAAGQEWDEDTRH